VSAPLTLPLPVPLSVRRGKPVLIALSVGLFLYVLARTAWVCDDAYIVFRTVDNFVNGFGLRWNVDERVQTYTCPLWTLLLSGPYFFTREPYYTSLAISGLLSAAAVLLVLWRVRSWSVGVFVALALASSKSFTDFSTSGLENPLTHALLALFLFLYLSEGPIGPRRLFQLALLSAFVALNRLDSLLLVLPALMQAAWVRGEVRRRLLLIGVAFLPLAAWEGFSLIYYGFLFPNTAYAKLNNGIPAIELAQQGVRYIIATLWTDPVLFLCISIALVMSTADLVTGKGRGPSYVSAGILLYLAYVVKIGGDFMVGRFFSAIFLAAVMLIVHCARVQHRLGRVSWAAMTAVMLLASIFTIGSPLRSGSTYGLDALPNTPVGNMDVTDERAFYYRDTGLFRADIPPSPAFGAWKQWGLLKRSESVGRRITSLAPNVGVAGYYGGPNLHLIDVMGLCDPLLARLQPIPRRHWRAGHFDRSLPAGYFDTWIFGHLKIRDRDLAEYDEHLTLITNGNLWSEQRLIAILKMNLGEYDPLLRATDERNARMPVNDPAK
jgi:arabinofuranosyltransferase